MTLSPPADPRVGPTELAEVRGMIGVPLRRLRHNTLVSHPAINRWAKSIGDRNPLWLDPTYAAGSVLGRTAAPPLWLYSVDDTAPCLKLPGLHVRLRGSLLGVSKVDYPWRKGFRRDAAARRGGKARPFLRPHGPPDLRDHLRRWGWTLGCEGRVHNHSNSSQCRACIPANTGTFESTCSAPKRRGPWKTLTTPKRSVAKYRDTGTGSIPATLSPPSCGDR